MQGLILGGEAQAEVPRNAFERNRGARVSQRVKGCPFGVSPMCVENGAVHFATAIDCSYTFRQASAAPRPRQNRTQCEFFAPDLFGNFGPRVGRRSLLLRNFVSTRISTIL